VSHHEEIRDLLPWYAAGTLDAGESAAVEAALGESEELRRELRELRALQGAVLAPRAEEPVFRPALIAGAWQRIDAYEATRRTARRTRLRVGLRSLFAGLSPPAQWALATQFAVILALAGVLAVTINRPHVFETSAGSSDLARADGPALSVTFEPTASEAQIRSLLERLDAQIVAGPASEQQTYTLRLAHGDAAAADHALGELRAARGVVRFAQREGS